MLENVGFLSIFNMNLIGYNSLWAWLGFQQKEVVFQRADEESFLIHMDGVIEVTEHIWILGAATTYRIENALTLFSSERKGLTVLMNIMSQVHLLSF